MTEVRREIVSFVRRSNRMRPQQLRAWDRHYADFVLDVSRQATSTSVRPGRPLDLAAAFGREAPLIVEVGPGTGESLLPMARERPESNVLAFEVYSPAIAQILRRLAADQIENVRLVQADAAAGLAHLLPPSSIAELWTFFPDPWPKARHHKRRLITPAFADLAAARVEPGGLWRLATDWADYAEAMAAILERSPAWTAVDEQDRADRPVTRFERRGLEAGRPVLDFTYRRAR
jgi:tRNA (guanine-N7-)-methyltransferase